MKQASLCHIMFVNKNRVCVSMCVNGDRPYGHDIMQCEWTAVTESEQEAFPTMHMRTEGGTHELIEAARTTCHQTWLLLQCCGSKLTLHTCTYVHTQTPKFTSYQTRLRQRTEKTNQLTSSSQFQLRSNNFLFPLHPLLLLNNSYFKNEIKLSTCSNYKYNVKQYGKSYSENILNIKCNK